MFHLLNFIYNIFNKNKLQIILFSWIILIFFLNSKFIGTISCVEKSKIFINSANTSSIISELAPSFEIEKGCKPYYKFYLHNIGFYDYHHYDTIIGKKKDLKLFKSFLKHPLLFWRVEVTYGNQLYLLDYVSNLSSNSKHVNVSIIKGVNFVDDPSMFLYYNDFENNFSLKSNNQEFKHAFLYSDIYKEELKLKLSEIPYKNGFFYQKLIEGILHLNRSTILFG